MVKKSKNNVHHLPLETEIEVFAFKGKEVHKLPMKFGEWMRLKMKKGWKYSAYQKGFCTIKENKKNVKR